MTARVVCIGIATLDAIVTVELLPRSDERVPAFDGRLAGGGVAATAAVTLARLGVEVTFIGRVGSDAAGRLIRDGLADEGVDVRGLRLDAARSPVSTILVESGSGLRAIAPYLGSGEGIALDAGDLRACADAEWVHIDERAAASVDALAAAGIATPISVDDGTGRPTIDFARVALYGPTAAVLAARFPAASLDASADACLAAGPSLVAITRGAAGSVAARRGNDGRVEHAEVPAFAVDVVSTLGAGDVFHGALLAAIVEGRPMADALRFANAVAALSCRGLDGRSAIPSRQEVDEWLRSDPPTREADAPAEEA
jgi:sulfofructose kinase